MTGPPNGYPSVMSTDTQTSQSLTDALDGLRFAMVGTLDPRTNQWASRPLALAEQDGEVLRFLVSTEATWVSDLDGQGSPSGVTFSDPGKNTYVGLQGTAHVRNDRGTIDRVWNPGAAAWFDGKDDPTVRVLEVTVASGEYWDGPSGRLGSAIALVRAALGDDPGTEGSITLA